MSKLWEQIAIQQAINAMQILIVNSSGSEDIKGDILAVTNDLQRLAQDLHKPPAPQIPIPFPTSSSSSSSSFNSSMIPRLGD